MSKFCKFHTNIKTPGLCPICLMQENERLKKTLREIKEIEDQWDNCIPECDVCYKVQEIAGQA